MMATANTTNTMDKKEKGQFYTVNCQYILDGLVPSPHLLPADTQVIEPFAGAGHLVKYMQERGFSCEAYDIDPRPSDSSIVIQHRDTLRNPPSYSGKFVITNPPYLARNKTKENTDLFERFGTNDLYKCFIYTLVQCDPPPQGGVAIIPAGFFLSPRDIDVKCRAAFMNKFRVEKVRYFCEPVFNDTPTTVVAFSFSYNGDDNDTRPYISQEVSWQMLPSGDEKTFTARAEDNWIIGGDIYRTPITDPRAKVRRFVDGKALEEGEWISGLLLVALDSGKANGRIRLEYKEGYVYKGKETSRSFATLIFKNVPELSPEQQKELAERFNDKLEQRRTELWSLFLPQYRESKEYARKRIPFELAYRLVLSLLP